MNPNDCIVSTHDPCCSPVSPCCLSIPILLRLISYDPLGYVGLLRGGFDERRRFSMPPCDHRVELFGCKRSSCCPVLRWRCQHNALVNMMSTYIFMLCDYYSHLRFLDARLWTLWTKRDFMKQCCCPLANAVLLGI